MGNTVSRPDDVVDLPDESWTEGWFDEERDEDDIVVDMQRCKIDEDMENDDLLSHRDFMRRFRLPYQLFKQLVVYCKEVNLDACADDIDELLNIGGSTVNNIFKDFVSGCQEKLYHKHVYVPEGAELDKIVETYTK
ncbi:hypothetical protein B484DRAFT_401174 [Ochromonadaceae sp. CCMP2298]|nr:hypothetical protein B484DRAFT_401174 [Ochromonadaceae sp. CCMP2298]